jgi:hypothetical protein
MAKLTFEEELAFTRLIRTSMMRRCSGEVERREDRPGDIRYRPTDGARSRELLAELWGGRVMPNELDRICGELVGNGADIYETWPNDKVIGREDAARWLSGRFIAGHAPETVGPGGQPQINVIVPRSEGAEILEHLLALADKPRPPSK